METTGYIDVVIDEFTPCLKNNETGELVETEVIRIKRKSFLNKYNQKNSWRANWAELSNDSEIYALVLKGTVDIQGMIALKYNHNMKAVFIKWACAAPHNNPRITPEPKYSGVGGHLFAIAGNKSYAMGFDGDVYGFAANEKLLNHYVTKLGAKAICIIHEFHFIIVDDAIKKITEVYTYDDCTETEL